MRSAHIAYGYDPESQSAFVADGSELALVILDIRPGDLSRLTELAQRTDVASRALTEVHADLIGGRWHPDMGVSVAIDDKHSLSVGLIHTDDDADPEQLIDIGDARSMLSTSLSAGVTSLLAHLERGDHATNRTGDSL